MNKKIFAAFAGLAASALVGCGSNPDTVFSYKVDKPVQLELYSEGYYATIDLEGIERMGTITGTYMNVEFSSSGDTSKVKRIYEIDKSRGYLKNYLPSELAWRIGSVEVKGIDREVVEIKGLDKYDSLVDALPMPKRWSSQLKNPDYAKHLVRAEKHRFEMTHLLTGGPYPEYANITEQLKAQNRLNFALIGIDSVVAEGFQRLNKRRCFTYTVYFTETESFPYYIWEQHVNSGIVPVEYQKYNKGLKAEYHTAYQVALEPNGGVLCQEREVKQGVHTMVNPATGDTATFQSNITLERLYNTIEKTEE